MSIKFRTTDPVSISFIDQENQPDYSDDNKLIISDVRFVLGPIINRVKCGWSTYDIILHPNVQLDQKLAPFDKLPVDNKISFETFKKHFTGFHAVEIQDKFTPLTEDDLLNDLDFIHDEVAKIQILMNTMKQKGEIERYNFYNDLIGTKMYKMFQFPTKDEFDTYINKIRYITEQDKETIYNQRVNDIKNISTLVWG